MKFPQFAIATIAALMLLGCRKEAASAPAAEPAVAKEANTATNRSFLVRGVVKEVDAKTKTVTIQHEKIPDYMDAMTMPFRVKDVAELNGLEAGDTIWFRLWIAPDESWIDKVKKEPKQAESAPQASTSPEREGFRIARDVDPLSVGDVMPDYRFTNELGQAISLSQFKGQALAFTFIYTRCPLPDFCPRMSKNFTEVCQKLASMPNAPTNWHLLSISFDPTFDTPEVLKGYSYAFQNDPKRWNFVAGSLLDTDAITDQFNLIIVKSGADWNHKLRTVVVDANGRIQKIIYGNEWKPEELVEEMIKAAKPGPAQQVSNR